MWLRTQRKDLINLSQCSRVQKVGPLEDGDESGWSIMALDVVARDWITIASGMTEDKADTLLHSIWRRSRLRTR